MTSNTDEGYSLRLPLALTLFAILERILLIPTSLLKINPYSQNDAPGYELTAQVLANSYFRGTIEFARELFIYKVWGAILSPFYALPGPSRIYSRVAIALLGGFIVWNFYWIVRHHASRQAAVLSVLPFLTFPSLVLIHASLHREAVVLAGILFGARTLAAPQPRLSRFQRLSIVVACLLVLRLFRPDNLPVYLAALGAGVITHLYMHGDRRKAIGLCATGTASVVGAFVLDIPSRVLSRLAMIRVSRAHGDSVHFADVTPSTVVEAISYSWVGMGYFLFAPFPWMVESMADFVVGVEGLITILYFAFAILGFRVVCHRSPPVAVSLAVYVLFGAFFYGLVETNFGAAVRHRQMFTWVLFALGGIGLSSMVSFRLRHSEHEQPNTVS